MDSGFSIFKSYHITFHREWEKNLSSCIFIYHRRISTQRSANNFLNLLWKKENFGPWKLFDVVLRCHELGLYFVSPVHHPPAVTAHRKSGNWRWKLLTKNIYISKTCSTPAAVRRVWRSVVWRGRSWPHPPASSDPGDSRGQVWRPGHPRQLLPTPPVGPSDIWNSQGLESDYQCPIYYLTLEQIQFCAWLWWLLRLLKSVLS